MADTSGTISEVVVAKLAADLLDDYAVSTLDDDTPLGRFLARNFGIVRDELLQFYPWHVASTRAVLSSTTTPSFGWAYQYSMPSDCLRLLPLRDLGRLDGAPIPYEVENRKILTNQPPDLYIRYVKRLSDLSTWSPLMARALAARLAVHAATRVTGKLTFYEKAKTEFRDAMLEATHADSQERGPAERYTGAYDYGEDVFTARGLY